MPCCGQPADGYAKVWQLRVNGKVVAEHGTQREVETVRAQKHNGAGIVISAIKKTS